MRDPRLLLAVAVGGAVGALARAGTYELLPAAPGTWPWATLLVNLVGAFILGAVLTGMTDTRPPSMYLRPLLAGGFCGALTTFSSLQLEVAQLGRDGHAPLAFGYLAASILLGLLCVAAGVALTERLRPHP